MEETLEQPETLEVREAVATEPRKLPIETWDPGSFSHPKILIYGASGAGKTRFASTAPKPLFADAEEGMRSVTAKGVARWPIKSWLDLRLLFKYLINDGGSKKFSTLVIDSLNEIQRLAMDNVLSEFTPGQGGVPRRNYESLPSMNDYQKALDDFSHLIRTAKSLPMNVIMTATTSGTKSAEEAIEPAFTGRNTVGLVSRYCDVIGYLKVVEGDSGTPARILCFDLPEALTKDRSGRLPAVLYHPTYPSMAKLWEEK